MGKADKEEFFWSNRIYSVFLIFVTKAKIRYCKEPSKNVHCGNQLPHTKPFKATRKREISFKHQRKLNVSYIF